MHKEGCKDDVNLAYLLNEAEVFGEECKLYAYRLGVFIKVVNTAIVRGDSREIKTNPCSVWMLSKLC